MYRGREGLDSRAKQAACKRILSKHRVEGSMTFQPVTHRGLSWPDGKVLQDAHEVQERVEICCYKF